MAEESHSGLGLLLWSPGLLDAHRGINPQDGLVNQRFRLAISAPGSLLGGRHIHRKPCNGPGHFTNPWGPVQTRLPLVGLGLVYKAPYIWTTSWTEAYFHLKLASQAEASCRTTESKVVFVQIQASSRVIPLPGVPTLFLNVKSPEDITDSKVARPPQDFRGFGSMRSFSGEMIHRPHR